MSKYKVKRISQEIMDPQELTEFLPEGSTTIESTHFRAFKAEHEKLENISDSLPNNTPEIVAQKKAKTGWKRFLGIACALATGICLQICNIIIKILKSQHHPINLAFWRFFTFILLTLPYLLGMKIFKNVNLFSSIGMDNELTRLCGCCTGPVKYKNLVNFFIASALIIPVFILRYASLNYLTIADSTVITYSGPLFTIVLGHFFLQERCGFVTIPISLFTLLGVVVVSRPTFLTGNQDMDDSILIGIGITLFSTVLASIVFVLMRRLRHVNFMVMSFASGGMGLIIGGIVVWIVGVFKVPEGMQEILLIFALGLLSFLGTCLLVAALKFEEAGTISIVRTVDVFYSFILEFVWFNLVPDIYSIVGAIIVVTGVTLITFRKVLSTLPREHCLRRAFCFLLH